jgi:lysophospholipase L1-like esterase
MRSRPEWIVGLGLVACAVAIAAIAAFSVGGALLAGSPANATTPQPSATLAAPTPTVTSEATATPTATPTAIPTPATPPLPTMLAAIGDSYTQAWSVSPAYKKDHPQFSWAVGTDPNDGVLSLRERLSAVGDKAVVFDAATSGRKMSDASRQASLIVAQAATLPAGSTVYVTFELGTNDLCDDPMTPAADFEVQLRASIDILRGGLPTGSRILMLSVPDFVHFWEITQADPTARAALGLRVNSRNCAPFLGKDTSSTFAQSKQRLADYDAILTQVCAEIENRDGASGRLYCRSNQLALSEKDFTVKDLSTVDYFHPSLSGQAKMAEAAWQAGYWASLPLAGGGRGLAAAADPVPLAPGLALVAPAVARPWPRAKRRRSVQV